MTLDEIASRQQTIAGKQSRGASSLQRGRATAEYPRELERGKYSDSSSPLTPPWVAMPDGAFPFATPGVIDTPAVTGGPPYTWTDVFQMQVPNGYDGVARRLKNTYNGQGFQIGSGQLIWRILQNGQAVRGYDNILVEYGEDVTGYTDGIRFASGSLIEYQVTNVSLVAGGTQIFCFLGGWFYPNKLMGK